MRLTQFNYKTEAKQLYKKFGESQTIPDQTMSIRQILQRYASGQPLDVYNQGEPIWDGEEGSGINPKTLDLSELHQYFDNIQQIKDDYQKTRNEKIKQEDFQRMLEEMKQNESSDQEAEQQ
jgi:Fe-S-cluster formation regulator IscX/YfhJ